MLLNCYQSLTKKVLFNQHPYKRKMKNLNEAKLTNQEKERIIRCSIDREYRQRVEKAENKGYYYAPTMWVGCPESIAFLNREATKMDSWFDFYEERILEIYPETHIIMLEGERVLEGEWDKTYERWSPHSYQRVYCIALNGEIEDFTDEGVLLKVPTAEAEAEALQLYPKTFNELGGNKGMFGMGLLDIPLDIMNKIDDYRCENHFGEIKDYENRKEQIKRENLKKIKRQDFIKGRKWSNDKKNKKQPKKGFRGGFI